MFRRKKDDSANGSIMPPSDDAPQAEPAAPHRQFTRPAVPAASAATTAATAGAGRPAIAGPAPAVRPTASRERPIAEPPESKKLIVGREIVLSGQITSCDRLIVEGRVEASLSDSKSIEIAESGLFKGSAEIDSADVAGQFEGNLTVRGRLTVRATGRINGQIRYGQIEIEAGGEIGGDIQPSRGAKSVVGGTAASSGSFEGVPYVSGGTSD